MMPEIPCTDGVEDGLGAKASYRYDTRGNCVSEEQIISGEESSDSRRIARKIRYSYDRTGRLSEKLEILDSGLAEADQSVMEMAVARYTYDANGNRTGIITPKGYHITREYDCRDRLISERVEDRKKGTALTTSFTYDKAGNVTSVRQQSAEGKTREITYSHDLKDRLRRFRQPHRTESNHRKPYPVYRPTVRSGDRAILLKSTLL